MFHGVLADVDADPGDMFFAGTLLAMIHSRSRWDNLKQAEEVLLDVDGEAHGAFMVFRIAVHSSVFRNSFPPAVAPGWGVLEDDWSAR